MRYIEFEIIGPPEIRDVDPNARYFNPEAGTPLGHRPVKEPPKNPPQGPKKDPPERDPPVKEPPDEDPPDEDSATLDSLERCWSCFFGTLRTARGAVGSQQ